MKTSARSRTLDTVEVAEIMTREVWTVTPEASVRDLIQLLSQEQITGAPVVSGSGKLRGVVSVTDVLRLAADEPIGTVEEETWPEAWEEFEQDAEKDATVAQSYFLDIGNHGVMLRPGTIDLPLITFDQHAVADIMTPATFTVRPNTSVRELSEFLARGRIHRALVTEDDRLVGIVTAFDVVRAIAGIV